MESESVKESIKPRNEKGRPHGYWETYWGGTDNLMYKCFFIDGEKNGYDECHYLYDNDYVRLCFNL